MQNSLCFLLPSFAFRGRKIEIYLVDATIRGHERIWREENSLILQGARACLLKNFWAFPWGLGLPYLSYPPAAESDIQGDHSGSVKPPVDTKEKLRFSMSSAYLSFDVNRRFDTI